jgi:cell surface protein SprA
VEAAYLIPGHSKAIGNAGTSYIDDFEGSVSTIDMRTQSLWFHGRHAAGQTGDLFPEGDLVNDLRSGFRRALLAWYVIDPLFFRNNNLTPANIAGRTRSAATTGMREVLEQEVFPNRSCPPARPATSRCWTWRTTRRNVGPYNYNPDLDGWRATCDPENNWAGISGGSPPRISRPATSRRSSSG